MKFLKYILAYFCPQNNMAQTLQDLDAAIALAKETADATAVAAQANVDAVNAAAARVAALPTSVDYTAQVDAVTQLRDTVNATNALITQATNTANGIAP